MSPEEQKILDLEKQTQIICSRCGATLAEYRMGQKCTAEIQDPCPGFKWVEFIVGLAPYGGQQGPRPLPQ